MNRLLFLVLFLTSQLITYPQSITNDNREPSRATFMSYRSSDARKTRQMELSENYSDLSGEWSYEILTIKDAKGKITLPSSIELSALLSATYTDGAYSFLKGNPEKGFPSPTEGRQLSLQRDFSIPFDYTHQMVYLHIGAASSQVEVYVNGDYVGSSTDSRSPAEFDISPFVTRGLNNVELRVNQFTNHSYLEGQSGWQLTGINRDIYLFSQPKIRARDFLIRTSLDHTYSSGLLETALILKTELLNRHQVKVYYDLYDPEGELVNQNSREVELDMRGEDTIRFTASIPNVKLWNAETPRLYTIMYRIQREGRFTEYVALKAGFRSVEIKEGQLRLNGQSIKIKGVNLSEFSPKTGNVMSDKELKETLLNIKLAGFNAIRTDGYSMPAEFYLLCDEIGLYVHDVANINAQGVGQSRDLGYSLANEPSMLEQFKYRVNNTFQRNKTHASVIIWGLGDSAGNGYNMYEAYMMLRAEEPVRPIMYNDAGWEFNSEIYCTDFQGFDHFQANKSQSDGQPVIFSRCEFDPRIWQREDIQGGFLTRWISPAITSHGRFAHLSEEYKLAELPSGRIEKSSVQDNLEEITEFMQGVKIHAIDARKGIYKFENRLDFTNFSDLDISYYIVRNGVAKRESKIEIDILPSEEKEITLPGGAISPKDELVIKIGNLAKYSFII